jgi:transcriptional regulator with XRE-family HTH domain
MTILEILRRVIKDHNLSFRELERRTGIRRQILMDCVQGRAKPKFSTLKALFKVFEIDFDMQPSPVAGKNKVSLKWKGPPPLKNKAETRVLQRGTPTDGTKRKPAKPRQGSPASHHVG